jgi:hypothetical protein
MGCIHQWTATNDTLILKEDCEFEVGKEAWLDYTYKYQEIDGILFMDLIKAENQDGVKNISDSSECQTTVRESRWDNSKSFQEIITSVTMPTFCSSLAEIEEEE